jgi:hypothetical protein
MDGLRRVDEAIARACERGLSPTTPSSAVIADKAAPCPHRPVPNVARPRRTASPSAARAGGDAQHSTIKVIVMLALGIRGLVEIIERPGAPWRPLFEAILFALLALAFFSAAPRSCGRRFPWLLSASAAAA